MGVGVGVLGGRKNIQVNQISLDLILFSTATASNILAFVLLSLSPSFIICLIKWPFSVLNTERKMRDRKRKRKGQNDKHK